jgi:hypothetical protein
MLNKMISSVSGKVNTSGDNLTVDSDAIFQSTSTGNIAIGLNALDNTGADSDNNIAIGVDALTALTTGDNNTTIGYATGDTITTGSTNTLIGYDADVSSLGVQNQNVFGASATSPVGNNTVTLGNADVTKVFMSQDADAVMYADGTINTSDKRWKKNIEDSDLGLSFINSVRPVKYNFKSNKQSSKLRYGIIAQEVIEVLKTIDKEDFAGIETENPDKLGADYIQFVAPLIKAVQELSAEVEKLKNK